MPGRNDDQFIEKSDSDNEVFFVGNHLIFNNTQKAVISIINARTYMNVNKTDTIHNPWHKLMGKIFEELLWNMN
jgi:hypothetical protein